MLAAMKKLLMSEPSDWGSRDPSSMLLRALKTGLKPSNEQFCWRMGRRPEITAEARGFPEMAPTSLEVKKTSIGSFWNGKMTARESGSDGARYQKSSVTREDCWNLFFQILP